MNKKNLTSPMAIRHAIERTSGKATGAVKELAESIGTVGPVISQNIHGHRKQEKILQGIADYIGQPVFGVYPNHEK